MDKRSTLRYFVVGAFVAVVTSAGCNGPLTRPSSPGVEPFPALTDSSFVGSVPPDYTGRFAGSETLTGCRSTGPTCQRMTPVVSSGPVQLTLLQSNLSLSGELSFVPPSPSAVSGVVTASGFMVNGTASGTPFKGKFTQVGDGQFNFNIVTEDRKDGVLVTTLTFEGTLTRQ